MLVNWIENLIWKKNNNNRQAFDYSIAIESLLWQKRISFIFPFPLSIWPDIRYVKFLSFLFFSSNRRLCMSGTQTLVQPLSRNFKMETWPASRQLLQRLDRYGRRVGRGGYWLAGRTQPRWLCNLCSRTACMLAIIIFYISAISSLIYKGYGYRRPPTFPVFPLF